MMGKLGTLLCVAFVVLKLCDVITWSWLWVLSPVWISILIDIINYTCMSLVAEEAII